MSHDARPGSERRHARAIEQLMAALTRDAEAADELGAIMEAAATASLARSRALQAGGDAAVALGNAMGDPGERERMRRLGELMRVQARQHEAESRSEARRGGAARAEATRSLAQRDMLATLLRRDRDVQQLAAERRAGTRSRGGRGGTGRRGR